jgi:2-polyprenyl-3-methyl-5-hydroxy-6-metoxy-1,4-benzoquinol methylase
MLNVPVHCNVLWPSRDEAQHCSRGDIKLAFCPNCSFITNIAFEPKRLEYMQTYENPLHFSPLFQDYARSLALRLVERYNLYNKDIVSIGCGDGYFLLLLCEIGKNRGVGFDPAYVEQEEHYKLKDRVKFIRDFYSEGYRNYQADLFVCQQTLEHIHDPKSFMKMLRQAIGNRLNTHIFFEVPNAVNTFQNLFVWDIIYEHSSYFTPHSLFHIFSSCQFQVCRLTEEYKGQYLYVDALASEQSMLHFGQEDQCEVDRLARNLESFAASYLRTFEKWRHRLEQIEKNGERAVIWGAGSKGVTFLNVFKDFTWIEYAVDINPRKQGMYVAGTGQRIVSPEFLREYQPDLIIVMNPVYNNEIAEIAEHLGIVARLISL